MQLYKNHFIHSVAIPRQESGWKACGLVLAVNGTTELKRLELAEIVFVTNDEAEAFGLKICKIWIDAL